MPVFYSVQNLIRGWLGDFPRLNVALSFCLKSDADRSRHGARAVNMLATLYNAQPRLLKSMQRDGYRAKQSSPC